MVIPFIKNTPASCVMQEFLGDCIKRHQMSIKTDSYQLHSLSNHLLFYVAYYYLIEHLLMQTIKGEICS